MNFNRITFFLLLTCLGSACGVKGDPHYPPATELPNWENYYSQKPDAEASPKPQP